MSETHTYAPMYVYPNTNPPIPCSYKSTLHTARLILTIANPHSADDIQFALRCLNDPTAIATVGDYGIRKPVQMAALKAGTQLYSSHTPSKLSTSGPANYIVSLASDSTVKIGIISLASRRASIPPDMGWLLLGAHHGHGYATEAGRVFLDYFLHEFEGGMGKTVPPIGVIAWLKPSNVASVRVAEKLGMVEMGEVDGGEGEDEGGTVVYGVPGLGINGGRRFTRDTVVDFFGEGEAGNRARSLIGSGRDG